MGIYPYENAYLADFISRNGGITPADIALLMVHFDGGGESRR